MAPEARVSEVDKLHALLLPPAAEWAQRYRGASQRLPFPLGHLLLGVYRQRLQNPAAFVSCLTWFFEAAYRFLLALVLRPLILRGPLDGEVWGFLGHILSLPDGGDRKLSLGAWKDFFFECFSRVLKDERARRELPHFLHDYSRHPDELDRLRVLYSAFVHFRNRLDHQVRDGNALAFQEGEADLYERALIQFLLDFESLSEYGLVLFDLQAGTHARAAEVTSQGLTLPRPDLVLPPNTVYAKGGAPIHLETLLVKWSPNGDRALEAWTMYPFLTFSERGDGHLDAHLFRQYVPRPEPTVYFDPAIADRAGALADQVLKATDPALLGIVQRLCQIVLDRKTKSRPRPDVAEDGSVESRVIEEQARELRQLIEEKQREAEQRRRVHLDRIPYPRDPLFRGREKDIEDVVAALRSRRSLQVQSYLYGMGGVGKTALAVEICHRLVEEQVFQDGVLWYRVQIESAEDAARECVRALKLGPKIEHAGGGARLVEAFRELIRGMDVLVVLDNADYPLEMIQPLFDLFQGNPLLITSRNELDLPGALTIRLGGMEPVDAVQLVKAVLGQRDHNVPEAWKRYGKEEEIAALASTLGNLPLALKLAAYHMLQQRLTVRDYLERWRTQRDRFELLQARLPEKEGRLRDVRACFALSFDRLNVQAQRLLMHLGQWEGRELSLSHLRQTLDEVIYPPVDHHQGRVTSIAEVPDTSCVLTGGDDGRVLLWTREATGAPPVTVVRMGAPVVRILPPIGLNPLVVADSENTVVSVPCDCSNTLIGKPAWRKLNGPWSLAKQSDGAPAVEVVAGRHAAIVPLDGSDAEVRPHRESEDAAMELSGALQSWVEQNGMEWAPVPVTKPGPHQPPPQGWLGGLADEEGHVEESRPLERGDHDWAFESTEPPEVAKSSEEDGLKDLVVRGLVTPSLAEDRMTDDGVIRMRLHPLVSEFALELLPLGRRHALRGKIQRFYVGQFGKDKTLIDSDEDNITAACMWLLDDAQQQLRLEAADDVCHALDNRFRWRLLRQIYEARIRDANSQEDQDKAAELKCGLFRIVSLMSPHEARTQASQTSRELVEWRLRLPLDRRMNWGLSMLKSRFWLGILSDPTEIERQFRLERNIETDPEYVVRFLGEWLVAPPMGAVLERFAATTHYSEVVRTECRILSSEYFAPEERLRVGRDVVDLGVRVRDEGTVAYALHGVVETLIALGNREQARAALEEYRALAELRGSEMVLAICAEMDALLLAREGRMAEAGDAARRAIAMWYFGGEELCAPVFAKLIHLLVVVGDWNGVVGMLGNRRDSLWPATGADDRWAFHAASAAVLLKQERTEEARTAWARAEAYKDTLTTPIFDLYFRELSFPGEHIQLSRPELDAARQVVWGRARAPRIMVQPPELREEPTRFLLSAHLRWHAITLGEVRAFCAKAPAHQIPWYYRHVRPDAPDEEPARFLDYSLAAEVSEWLGEELPAAAHWRGLPPHEAWRPQPTEVTETEPVGGVPLAEWAEGQCLFQELSSALIEPMPTDARDMGRGILLSDVLSPHDKWRLVARLSNGGMEALDTRTRGLLRVALVRPVPLVLAASIQHRLLLDWRSLAFLAGLHEATPRSLWLRSEFVAQPETFGALPRLGVVGSLRFVEEPRGMLLVPGRCAWADVLAWPSSILDPSSYTEEAPPWP